MRSKKKSSQVRRTIEVVNQVAKVARTLKKIKIKKKQFRPKKVNQKCIFNYLCKKR